MIIFLVLLLACNVSSLESKIWVIRNTTEECHNEPSCSTLAYIAKNVEEKDNVELVLDSGPIMVSTLIQFDGWTNLTIKGNETGAINCHNMKEKGPKNAGIRFSNCHNIKLSSVNLTYCSIEGNFSKTKEPYKFRSGLVIINTSNITILNVAITKSDGYGAVLINNYNQISITHSSFTRNALSKSYVNNTIGGSGMMILVSHCDINSGKNCTNLADILTNYTQYNIESVTFEGNILSKPDIVHDWMLSSGGGFNILLAWSSYAQNISILNTNFTKNTALCGGGFGLNLRDNTSNNHIIVHNCNFRANKLHIKNRTGGGGLKLTLHVGEKSQPGPSSITFNSCVFAGNKAFFGGGVALKIAGSEVNTINQSIISFKNSSWLYNSGSASTAVDVSPQVQNQMDNSFYSKPEFENCQFIYNFPSKNHTTGYKATFLIAKIQVYFKGNNYFLHNYKTGLRIVSANVLISENSSMTFENNYGHPAGAIAMTGFSIIQYNNNVTFNFTENSGTSVGAIHYTSQDPHVFFSSHTCFVKSLKGNATNVSFHFTDNKPTTIFVTGLHSCKYACTKNDKTILPKNPFTDSSNNCLGQFYFHDSNNPHIITEASSANGTVDTIYFTPGKGKKLPVIFLDDLGQDITNITTYYPHAGGKINITSKIVGNNRLKLLGHPTTGKLRLNVQGLRGYFTHIPYQLLPCPTGYVLDGSLECHCSATLDSRQWYNGIIGCNDTEMSVFLLPDYWLGYIGKADDSNISDSLYSGQCPPGYCNMMFTAKGFLNGHFYEIKSEANQTSLSKYMCNNGREGILCGTCSEGSSTYIHSDHFKCQNESKYCHYGWLFYVLSELLPLTILFIIVIHYNISFTSGTAYSMTFFIQQLHIMEMSIHGIIQLQSNYFVQVVNFIYSIFNLQFFNAGIFSFCLWKGATTMELLVMRLVSVGYALCLLLLLVLFTRKFGRCRTQSKWNNSMVHGLTAFLVICYSEATHVSFNFLNYETLKGKGGKEYTNKVVFYNGDIVYFSREHLFYAIPALIALIFIILPTPLCLIADPILLKIEDRIRFLELYKPWTRLRERFKPILDSFQSCFKDNFRCFAGLFFLYRTAIMANLFIFSDNMQYRFVNEIILLIIFGIQSFAQPFNKKQDNVIASVALLALLIINTLDIRINIITGNQRYTSEVRVLQFFQIILMYLPLFIGLLWLAKVLCIKYKEKRRKMADINDYNIRSAEVSLIYNRHEDMSQYGGTTDDGK